MQSEFRAMADDDGAPLLPPSDAVSAKRSEPDRACVLDRSLDDVGRAVIFFNSASATLIVVAMRVLARAYNDPEYASKWNIYGAPYVYLRENYASVMIFCGVGIGFNAFFIFGAICRGLWTEPKGLPRTAGSLLVKLYRRRAWRRIADARTVARPLGLTDLPDVIFTQTSSCLGRESAALFAAAVRLMPHHTAQRERAILAARPSWRTLDFAGVGPELAARLSDDDVASVLVAIDAVNVLKKLRLTGCTGLTGSGLRPLRGSTALKTIDLTLFPGGAVPAGTKPSLSADAVIPVLTTIESLRDVRGENVLLPKFWTRRDLLRRRDQFVYTFFPKVRCDFCDATRLFASRTSSCDVCREAACCGNCEARSFVRRCKICKRAVCRNCDSKYGRTIEMLRCDDPSCGAVSGCRTVCVECLPGCDPGGRGERWCGRCTERRERAAGRTVSSEERAGRGRAATETP